MLTKGIDKSIPIIMGNIEKREGITEYISWSFHIDTPFASNIPIVLSESFIFFLVIIEIIKQQITTSAKENMIEKPNKELDMELIAVNLEPAMFPT